MSLRHSPVASLELEVTAGGLADRPAVAELTAGLVAQGAASKHGRTGEFARKVAALGAELAVDVEPALTRYRLTVPADQLIAAVGALGAMVEHRGLRATTYHSLRSRALSAARSRAGDDPSWLCRETLQRSLLGAGKATSRRATLGTYSELSRVRHAHCNQFYATHYRGDRTRLLIATSHPAEHVVKAAEAAFGRYPKSSSAPVAPTGPPPQIEGQPIYLVNHSNAPRSTVALGWVTPVVTPATLPALQVLVAALAATLRQPSSTAGQPASPMSPPEVSLLALPENRFLLVVSTTAPRASTLQSAAALAARLTAFVQAPVPPEQVTVLRRQLRTRLAVAADHPETLLRRAGELLALGGKPDDWLRLPARVASLTPGAVDRLRTSLSPPAVMVVVGDAAEVGPQLTGIGTVRVVNGRAGFGTVKTLPATQK
ncbi:MAG: insulinase family protein [Deltaproteobacteria bacterium]|nr:insulinase family protein [Deltaproteobacteria bacterium]